MADAVVRCVRRRDAGACRHSLQSLVARTLISGLGEDLLPELGCIVVFTRQGGGHVGFAVGRDKFGNLLILGGNQSDAMTIAHSVSPA